VHTQHSLIRIFVSAFPQSQKNSVDGMKVLVAVMVKKWYMNVFFIWFYINGSQCLFICENCKLQNDSRKCGLLLYHRRMYLNIVAVLHFNY